MHETRDDCSLLVNKLFILYGISIIRVYLNLAIILFVVMKTHKGQYWHMGKHCKVQQDVMSEQIVVDQVFIHSSFLQNCSHSVSSRYQTDESVDADGCLQ